MTFSSVEWNQYQEEHLSNLQLNNKSLLLINQQLSHHSHLPYPPNQPSQ